MKFTYRGNPYEVSNQAQLQFESTEQPNPKLRYRGKIYDYTPLPVVVSEADKIDWQIVTLVYRGNTYERRLGPSQLYQKPHALMGVGSKH